MRGRKKEEFEAKCCDAYIISLFVGLFAVSSKMSAAAGRRRVSTVGNSFIFVLNSSSPFNVVL